MPRLSSRIQVQPFGTRNPAAPGRVIQPAIHAKGPAQPQELFTDVDDPNVRRALQAVQQNVARATSQAKASPFAYANILFGVTLLQGTANGGNPTMVAHGLGVPPVGYAILSTTHGYVTAHAKAPTFLATNHVCSIWTTWTAWAGFSTVLADVLVYA